ncbi:MAG: sialidase family protein [Phycisphaeraceae bacterium]
MGHFLMGLVAVASLLAGGGLAAGDVGVVVGAGRQPQVVADGAGRAYVVYADGQRIMFSRSDDGGATFGQAQVVATVAGMPVGRRRGPRIAAGEKSLVITAIQAPQGAGKDGDLVAFTSGDGGQSWRQGDQPLNSVAGAAREGLHNMAAGPGGLVAVVWLDMRRAMPGKSGTELWIAMSTDGGQTWQRDQCIYISPSGTICECCHPSVIIGPDKMIHVMFRNLIDGNRDMYLTSSKDGGKTFLSAAKLGQGTWQLNACPMDGGSLAAGADAKLTTTWRRERQVYVAAPQAREQKLGEGMQPVVAWLADRPVTVWMQQDRLMLSDRAGAVIELAQGAAYPSVATLAQARTLLVAAEAGKQVRVWRYVLK